jgi:hypothetical protein
MKLSERFKPWRRSLRSLRQPNHNPTVGGAFKPSFIPPARPVTDDGELDRVLHPSQFYRQPADVLGPQDNTSRPMPLGVLSGRLLIYSIS